MFLLPMLYFFFSVTTVLSFECEWHHKPEQTTINYMNTEVTLSIGVGKFYMPS